jgi:phosphoglucomutase
MSTGIKFGTSGWRAIVADEFTVANIRLAVAGIAAYVKTQPEPHRVLVGRDPRFLGESFVAEAASVLAAAGVTPIVIPDAAPTPAIAYAVRQMKTSGAINFTASHNPPEYNGIKFSTHDGAPALPEVTKQIEAAIAAKPVRRRHSKIRSSDWRFRNCRRQARLPQASRRTRRPQGHRQIRHQGGLRSLLGRGPRLQLRAPARGRRSRRNRPRLPRRALRRPRPRARRPSARRRQGEDEGDRRQNLGIATDGDADRFGIVDEDGTFIQPNYIIALLFDYLVETRGWRNGVAKSVATTNLINALAEYHKVPLYETPGGLQVHWRAHHRGQDRHRRRRVRGPDHPRPRARERRRHRRPADCRDGGHARQEPGRSIEGAVCQGWFLLSRSRELPLDPGGDGRVH